MVRVGMGVRMGKGVRWELLLLGGLLGGLLGLGGGVAMGVRRMQGRRRSEASARLPPCLTQPDP